MSDGQYIIDWQFNGAGTAYCFGGAESDQLVNFGSATIYFDGDGGTNSQTDDGSGTIIDIN